MGAGEDGGEGESLRDVMEEAEPFLRSLAKRLCRSDEDARDLVQDTFVHALHAQTTAPPNPRAYLAVILKNLFIDRCRRDSGRPNLVALDPRQEVSNLELEPTPAWGDISVTDVRAALEQLDSGFRRTYEMHVFEQRSYDEIAQELGINRLTVGTRLTRVRRKLRIILGQRFCQET